MKQTKELAEATTLTPQEAAAKAMRLRSRIYNAISETDIDHITTTLVGMAKNGDHKATMTVFNLIGAGAPSGSPQDDDTPPRVGNMVQVNVAEGSRDRVTVNAIGGDALKVAHLLLTRGPLAPRIVSAECEVPTEKVEELLQTGWFSKTPKGVIQLTPSGRQAVQQADEE
jgi:hypothetical protein